MKRPLRDNLQELSLEYLEQQISELEKLGKLVNKKFKGQDSYYIVNTHSTEDMLQSQEHFISYAPSTPLWNKLLRMQLMTQQSFTLN